MSHILAHCEGVPLHIEQMLHAFLESNLLFMASLALPHTPCTPSPPAPTRFPPGARQTPVPLARTSVTEAQLRRPSLSPNAHALLRWCACLLSVCERYPRTRVPDLYWVCIYIYIYKVILGMHWIYGSSYVIPCSPHASYMVFLGHVTWGASGRRTTPGTMSSRCDPAVATRVTTRRRVHVYL